MFRVSLPLIFISSAYALDLDTLKINLLKGEYKAAIAEADKLIAQDPRSDESYYILGLAYLKDGNYTAAADTFEAILKEFSGSRFKEEAMLGLGDSYLLRNDYLKAGEIYEGLIKNNPNTKFKAQLYYRLSEIGFKNGDTAQGRDYSVKLKEGFPLSLELKQGQEICLPQINNFNPRYSVQIGSFSNPDNASNLARKLSGSDYPAYIEESTSRTGSKIFRVRVGRLKTRQEAEDLNKRLTREGYPTKICP